jgi:glutamate dehydrogenase (NADP+)
METCHANLLTYQYLKHVLYPFLSAPPAGANMPSTAEAIKIFDKSGAILCAAKAANAGGVAVSGLEMAQNAMMSTWTREEVDAKLKNIMTNIYTQAADAAKKYGVNLAAGANIAGFERVATAMLAQGCV